MFAKIDAKTRRCEYELGTFEIENIWGRTDTPIYTGMHVDGVPDGIGVIKSGKWTRYATFTNNQFDGFVIYHEKSYGFQTQ